MRKYNAVYEMLPALPCGGGLLAKDSDKTASTLKTIPILLLPIMYKFISNYNYDNYTE